MVLASTGDDQAKRGALRSLLRPKLDPRRITRILLSKCACDLRPRDAMAAQRFASYRTGRTLTCSVSIIGFGNL